MKRSISLAIIAGFLFVATQASAVILTEDFEAQFPLWETGWLGTNSNLQNYYGVGQGRGNNPDGLWVDDGDGIYGVDISEIVFNSAFGATLTSFSIDIAGHVGARLQVFDMSNSTLLDQVVTLTFGALTDPGVYSNYSVNSANGISKFALLPTTSAQIEGNTGIDNVVVSTDSQVSVPEPASIALLGFGLAGLGFMRRKRKA